ncbi:hypothetical protein R1flu_025915 [Riccia fluitans]|uniref:Uncharacterized protein n=1 Tax=Riccia fluitans TaxID=41844 RepID=A0ABD1Y002_9MARC
MPSPSLGGLRSRSGTVRASVIRATRDAGTVPDDLQAFKSHRLYGILPWTPRRKVGDVTGTGRRWKLGSLTQRPSTHSFIGAAGSGGSEEVGPLEVERVLTTVTLLRADRRRCFDSLGQPSCDQSGRDAQGPSIPTVCPDLQWSSRGNFAAGRWLAAISDSLPQLHFPSSKGGVDPLTLEQTAPGAREEGRSAASREQFHRGVQRGESRGTCARRDSREGSFLERGLA